MASFDAACDGAVADSPDAGNAAAALAAWTDCQADVAVALADWTAAEAGPRGDYEDELADAQADWIADEAAAWSTFTSIESPARTKRDGRVARPESSKGV